MRPRLHRNAAACWWNSRTASSRRSACSSRTTPRHSRTATRYSCNTCWSWARTARTPSDAPGRTELIMNIRKSLLILLPLALFATPAMADVKVFACEPEWAALAGELGGDKVDAYSATTPFQDPHFIQARPSLIARVRAADLMVCTGASLE